MQSPDVGLSVVRPLHASHNHDCVWDINRIRHTQVDTSSSPSNRLLSGPEDCNTPVRYGSGPSPRSTTSKRPRASFCLLPHVHSASWHLCPYSVMRSIGPLLLAPPSAVSAFCPTHTHTHSTPKASKNQVNL